MNDKYDVVEVAKENPLENFFDIEEGTTLVPEVHRTTENVNEKEYDKKEVEIDDQFQEIYDTALEAYEQQAEDAELVEGKYKARNQEIAVQFLNTALSAASNKATLKQNKEKLRIAENKNRKVDPTTATTGDMITGDRNAILRALREAKREVDAPPIDMQQD